MNYNFKNVEDARRKFDSLGFCLTSVGIAKIGRIND